MTPLRDPTPGGEEEVNTNVYLEEDFPEGDKEYNPGSGSSSSESEEDQPLGTSRILRKSRIIGEHCRWAMHHHNTNWTLDDDEEDDDDVDVDNNSVAESSVSKKRQRSGTAEEEQGGRAKQARK